MDSPPIYLMAIEDVAGVVQLLIAAAIILASAIAGILSKARQEGDESGSERPGRPGGSAPGVPRRPTVRRREPPQPVRPPLRRPRPVSSPVGRAATPVPSARVPRLKPHRPMVSPPPPPGQPILTEGAEPQPPHLQIAPMPSETISQQPGRPTSPLPARPVIRRKQWPVGRTQIRQAVIYAELLGQPLALRPERLW